MRWCSDELSLTRLDVLGQKIRGVCFFVAVSVCAVAHAQTLVLIQILDAGFESSLTGGRSPWRLVQHAGVNAYAIVRDVETFTEGKQSLRLTRLTPEFYGTVRQVIRPIEPGKYRFSLMLRTKGVDGGGWTAYVRVLKSDGEGEIFFGSDIVGDTDWKQATIEFDTPVNVTGVELGVTLRGGGSGWIDDTQLVKLR